MIKNHIITHSNNYRGVFKKQQQQKQNRYEKIYITQYIYMCPMKVRWARRPFLFGSTRKLRKKLQLILEFLIEM